MFVRTVDDVIGTDKELKYTKGASVLRGARLVTKEDGCGFSVSDVLITGGCSMDLHYKNHVEVNFVTSGQVTVQDLTSNETYELTQGMLYVVGPKDRHRMSTDGDAHIISIFCPATTGTERHDSDGSYPPTGEIPDTWKGEAGRTMFIMTEDDAHKLVISHGRTPASRYLLRDHACGVTVSTPRGKAGNESMLWYKNHVEANYVIQGEMTLEDRNTEEKWELAPGAIYVVGPNDRHRVRAKTDTYILSIFNPPLQGDETHDSDGSYPPSGEIPPAWRD